MLRKGNNGRNLKHDVIWGSPSAIRIDGVNGSGNVILSYVVVVRYANDSE